jgi:hypothetical protein
MFFVGCGVSAHPQGLTVDAGVALSTASGGSSTPSDATTQLRRVPSLPDAGVTAPETVQAPADPSTALLPFTSALDAGNPATIADAAARVIHAADAGATTIHTADAGPLLQDAGGTLSDAGPVDKCNAPEICASPPILGPPGPLYCVLGNNTDGGVYHLPACTIAGAPCGNSGAKCEDLGSIGWFGRIVCMKRCTL